MPLCRSSTCGNLVGSAVLVMTSSNMPGNRVGVVVVDHGSLRDASNQLVVELAAALRQKMGVANVEPAHMELAAPSLHAAFSKCVAQGAKHVIVVPYFLGPGRHVEEDIPRLTAEAAAEHPGVSHSVAEPLGRHPLFVQVLEERIVASLALDRANGGQGKRRCL